MTRRLSVVVSIDTEEDNWDPARSGITVENIRELPRLDRFFERLGIRGTYLTTYQVVTTPWARDLLAGLAASDRAEVGGHLHPWNTPPLREPLIPRNTMTKNLPATLQLEKLATLTDALTANLGAAPVSFRAGRYGVGPETLAALVRCGYEVDSSVTPHVSWEEYDDGPSFLAAPDSVYRLDTTDVLRPSAAGPLVEVPISCGFSRGPWSLWAPIDRAVRSPVLRGLHITGALARLGVVQRIMLSPELQSVAEMVALGRQIVAEGLDLLHVTWHSPSLRPGLSPFSLRDADVEALYAKVETFLDQMSAVAELAFCTVHEAAKALAPASPGDHPHPVIAHVPA
ncbi:MAG TPA: hypothetical protein VLT79_01125 [Gemmatimonadales bacterium]|nr:hypothetical protein [Gemmatimonadales bacterium]